MLKYIAKRIAYSILTLWLLLSITFFMMRMLPGDPFIGEKAIAETTRQQLYAKYGLDRPIIEQYAIYVSNAVQGDLGTSMYYKNRPITKIIGETFPYSFDLGVRALIFAVIAGLFLGIIAALKNGKPMDTTAVIIAVIGVSVPGFIMGALLQYGIGLKLSLWLKDVLALKQSPIPVAGWDRAAGKIIPSFALGLGPLATISRLMRTSMLDVLGQDYIKTAKAKGLSNRAVTIRHTIRNAILPVVTVLGPIVAGVLTGAFVIETVFNIPGMGQFFVVSVQTNDYTMIAGTTIFYGAFLIICNMLVDIAYGVVDPRIRLAR